MADRQLDHKQAEIEKLQAQLAEQSSKHNAIQDQLDLQRTALARSERQLAEVSLLCVQVVVPEVPTAQRCRTDVAVVLLQVSRPVLNYLGATGSSCFACSISMPTVHVTLLFTPISAYNTRNC